MRKPRFLPALPGLPGPSLPVIVLSFPAAWQSPGAGTAESGLLHPHHPPGVSGEAEAQECPVCTHVARQEQRQDMGVGHRGAAQGAGEPCPGLQLQQLSQWEAQLKARRQNLHPGGREAEPLLCPQLLSCPCPVACPLCPARARWQLSPSVATEPQRGLSSAYTALAPSKVSQHSCFSLTQARSCVPCPLRHNVPAWRLRGSSQHSAVVEAERGPCVRHFARPRVQMVWG